MTRAKKPSKPPTPRGSSSPAVPCPGLRAARLARGSAEAPLTIKAAAEAFGWGRERWSSWERLGRAPQAALEQVAAAWGVDLEQLTAGVAQGETPDPKTAVMAAVKQLRTALGRLSEAVGRFP